jgi:hypothetical protein
MHAAMAGASLWLAAVPSFATGVWFDIGANQETTVYENGGGPSYEHFPAYPFGSGWPAGTQVYAELAAASCAQLPAGCDPTNVAAAWVATFDGQQCGCGGVLNGACSLRLYYDPSDVAAIGASESALVVAHLSGDIFSPRWVQLSQAVLHPSEHYVDTEILGAISGAQFYGLFRVLPTAPPIEPTSWSRIKGLWR